MLRIICEFAKLKTICKIGKCLFLTDYVKMPVVKFKKQAEVVHAPGLAAPPGSLSSEVYQKRQTGRTPPGLTQDMLVF